MSIDPSFIVLVLSAAFAVEYYFVLLEIDGNRLGARVFFSQGRILDEFESTRP